MFHPVGSQPPSIYWRRRFALLASVLALVVLVVITLRVVLSDDPGSASAGGAASTSAPPASSPRASSTKASSSPVVHSSSNESSSDTSPAGSSTAKGSPSRSTPPPPKACAPSDLSLAAATNQTKYSVGDKPVLSIVVTNKSSDACVQDLADPQIVLRVYNGESRVWGSHDCKVVPGKDDRTLMAGSSVRVSITWTGLSSEPNCAGSRQRVGAGTYTLYASLSGHNGRAAQFTMN